MNKSDTIVHLVNRDKFTSDYVNFMKIKFPEYNHYFFIKDRGFPQEFLDEKNIIYYHSLKIFYFDKEVKSIWQKAKLIIISGFWGFQNKLYLMPDSFWKKTLVQFWGGDFYSYRRKSFFNKNRFKTWICLKRCRGYINLIDGEYEKLLEVFHIPKEHYVAPMANNPLKEIDFGTLRKKRRDSTLNILVGNSATRENQHKEAYEILSRFKDEDIEIFSPLSYGDEDYRDEAIDYGKYFFGDKFKPIVDYMEYYDYIKFLSTIDVGIFNNNRQQALGNISRLLAMGKRIYIRKDTSMWDSLIARGYKLSSIDELKKIRFGQIDKISIDDQDKNLKTYNRMREKQVEQWMNLFDMVN